jgi:putative endonuclease
MQQDNVRTAQRTRALGAFGERIAALHLESKGYRIVGRNVRLLRGEIDLVACDGEVTVFVEVRTRRGNGSGDPEETVTPRKARKLHAVATEFLARHPELPEAARVDLVAVCLDSRGRLTRLTHLEDVIVG